MSHRRKSLNLLGLALTKGLELGRHSFFLILPLGLLVAALDYALEPGTRPPFLDITDWLVIFFFFLGQLALSALHASIVLRMNAVRKGRLLALKAAFRQGIEKGIWVFCVKIVYLAIVLLVPMLFILPLLIIFPEFYLGSSSYLTIIGYFLFFLLMLPAIYLGIVFYFALFLIVLQDSSAETAWYVKFKNCFSESFQLVQGHWWSTFGVIFVIVGALVLLELFCSLLLEWNIVLATLFSMLAEALVLPFWYGCVLATLFELKKHH